MKKKITRLWVAIISIGLFLAGCGDMADSKNSEGGNGSAENRTQLNGTEVNTFEPSSSDNIISLKVVDGAEDGELILAGIGESDVYSLSVDDIPVYLDGKIADASVLEDGMTADISYNGTVLESFPAILGGVDGIYVYSLGSEKNPSGSLYDLSGLYLKVLEDLLETDEGLNSGIDYISVDLAEAPGNLTEGEKAAIAWIFASRHSAEMLTLSYEELVDQGYVENMGWEDGILFSISQNGEVEESYPTSEIKFNARKWRSGTGAYFFDNCQATWPEKGTWEDYTVGGYAISYYRKPALLYSC